VEERRCGSKSSLHPSFDNNKHMLLWPLYYDRRRDFIVTSRLLRVDRAFDLVLNLFWKDE
jgi:hypothetical protein